MAVDYQETLVRIDHVGKTAEVWTERRGLVGRLKRLGFVEGKRQAKGVWLHGEAKQVSFRRIMNKRPAPAHGFKARA